MKALVGVAVIVLLYLQYVLWFGQSGHFARQAMQERLAQQQQRVEVLQQRNQILLAEVVAMKGDQSVLEARARRDLGMVKSGEVFYLIPDVNL
ncbi:MAG: septum formation initiator family protein [bacterium]